MTGAVMAWPRASLMKQAWSRQAVHLGSCKIFPSGLRLSTSVSRLLGHLQWQPGVAASNLPDCTQDLWRAVHGLALSIAQLHAQRVAELFRHQCQQLSGRDP